MSLLSFTPGSVLRVGITGGIGSGKSWLLKYLSQYEWIHTLNLDLLGHEVQTFPHVISTIHERFGDEVLSDNGLINRAVLGKHVFSDKNQLEFLNKTMQPEMRALMNWRVQEAADRPDIDLVAVEGAIIIEAKFHTEFHSIWVTTLEETEAVGRILERNPELTREDAEARIRA